MMNKTNVIHVRLTDQELKDLNEIVNSMNTRPGVRVTQSDAIRYALYTQWMELQKERQAGPPQTFDGSPIEAQ